MRTPRTTSRTAARRRTSRRLAVLLGPVAAISIAAPATAAPAGADLDAGATQLVTVAHDGTVADNSSAHSATSADGRFVVFGSNATNLVTEDVSGSHIYLRDRRTGTTTLLSKTADGTPGNGNSAFPDITEDGRFVTYTSAASNLVAGDTNGEGDIFLLDRTTGKTEIISTDAHGGPADDYSALAVVSEDGRFVAFESQASDLVARDDNDLVDVFLRDRETGETVLVSHAVDGGPADHVSRPGGISADGRYVVFHSVAENLVRRDNNRRQDVFRFDRETGENELISAGEDGRTAHGMSANPTVSADGMIIAFDSRANDLVPDDRNRRSDVFVRDMETGAITMATRNEDGAPADGHSFEPDISADGRLLAFWSRATDIAPVDPDDSKNIFVHDLSTGTSTTVAPARHYQHGTVSPDVTSAGYVSFTVRNRLDPIDTNTYYDVYLERVG